MQAFLLAVLIIVFTIILGRFVIMDTLRSKDQKQFMKDMEEFDSSKFKLKK